MTDEAMSPLRRRMIIIETFDRGSMPRTHPIASIRLDTS